MHYVAIRHESGGITIKRKYPKLKGKANVKRAKRLRQRERNKG